MFYAVFHNEDFLNIEFQFFPHKGNDKVIPEKEKLSMVAIVATDHPREVFRLTNTIDDYWWHNEDVVKTFKEEGCRSTSIGDVFASVYREQSGRYIIATMTMYIALGYKPLWNKELETYLEDIINQEVKKVPSHWPFYNVLEQ